MVLDLTGRTFGRLTVLTKTRKPPSKRTFWECSCSCGNRVIVQTSNIGTTTNSCGCLKLDILGKYTRILLPLEDIISNQIYCYYRKNARDRKIIWKLSRDKVKELIFSPCYYCGITAGTVTKVDWITKRPNTLPNNGIDRLNSSLEYNNENCVPSCFTCNFAKRLMTVSEFVCWAKQIAELHSL